MSRRALRFKPGTAELVDGAGDAVSEVIAETLKQKLGGLADIKMPREADEPILAPTTRAVVFEWLAEIRARKELAAVGVKPRSTAMLFGPPGCGKTTLAHHLAARLGLPLVIMDTAAAHTMFLGQTGSNLAEFFAVLAAHDEPVVVLLDEFDSLGSTRSTGHSNSAGDKDMNHTVNVLLTKTESFEGMLLAASNREADIDPALWRRFGLHIDVALPGDDERFAIIKRYGEPYAIADEVIDLLAALMRGAPPSLLRQVMEGLKRALVLGPRLKLPTDDLPALVKHLSKAIAPHASYDKPPLWNNAATADRLKGLPWPPTRPA
jgi:SpoVK/Ycf46/Vps4 family AAA+-type ATPase